MRKLPGFILRYVVLKFKIGTSREPPELKHLSTNMGYTGVEAANYNNGKFYEDKIVF